MNDAFCSIIHGGLEINLKHDSRGQFKHCCIRNDNFIIDTSVNIWNDKRLIPLREKNINEEWDSGCENCFYLEKNGNESFRTGSNKHLSSTTNLSGPQRLDLMFDISCNLACRTCGPDLSTFWQKHLKENKIQTVFSANPEPQVEKMISILKTLDLSNLKIVVFCGGETLMGGNYWKVADAIADMIPDIAKNNVTLSFQTNGTHLIKKEYFEIIEKFHLVKLNISLDGVRNRFEYIRWPAKWEHVVKNIEWLKDNLPVNVMFLVEETISIFNLYYMHELDEWVKSNFSTNRLGDVVNHTKHLANGLFNISNMTDEYANSINPSLIPNGFKENPTSIKNMILEIQKFDNIRGENWTQTFPEVSEFYSRYL